MYILIFRKSSYVWGNDKCKTGQRNNYILVSILLHVIYLSVLHTTQNMHKNI